MPRFPRPGRGGVVRAALVLVLAALAAFAVGAVHGGAATPVDAERHRPGKAGQTATVSLDGDDPGRQRAPDERLQRRRRRASTTRASPSRSRARATTEFDATFTFQITLDAEQPDRRRAR